MNRTWPPRFVWFVYRVFDKERTLLYVGRTSSPERRIREHAKTSAWFADAAEWEITGCPDYRSMMDGERRAIQRGRPVYNIVYNERGAA